MNPWPCDECKTPVLEVRGENILIRSRHHGQDHVTIVPLGDIIKEAFKQQEGGEASCCPH